LLANGQAIGVDEEDAAEEPLARVFVAGEATPPPLFAADEMALTSELTTPVGSDTDGLARIEDKAEDKAGPTDAPGFVKPPIAELKAGAPVIAGSESKDDAREERAGFGEPPTEPPMPTPAPTPAVTPGRLAATDEAALAKEEATLAGIVAEGSAAIELKRLEIAGATEAAGFAVERKPSAEDAALTAACPAALGTEVASAAASEATEPRKEES
jgi:hypothetical protein